MLISHSLTCRTFWLPAQADDPCLALARKWAGQPDLEAAEDGSVHWVRPTKLNIRGLHWIQDSIDIKIGAQSALLALGQVESRFTFVSALAFLSPFSSAAATFKAMLPKIATVHQETAFAFSVDDFITPFWFEPHHMIRSIEGVTADGALLSVRGQDRTMSKYLGKPGSFRAHAVTLDVLGRTARIDRDFNVVMEDVTTPVDEATKLLREIFILVRPHLSVRLPSSKQASL